MRVERKALELARRVRPPAGPGDRGVVMRLGIMVQMSSPLDLPAEILKT
jgi:hypothetical protein